MKSLLALIAFAVPLASVAYADDFSARPLKNLNICISKYGILELSEGQKYLPEGIKARVEEIVETKAKAYRLLNSDSICDDTTKIRGFLASILLQQLQFLEIFVDIPTLYNSTL